jgi:hypothetical protein
MPLLEPSDIQDALNIDLTDPNGQALAESLIASATAFVSTLLGYPLEQAEVVESFNGEYSHLWLATGAPVSNLVMASYNSQTKVYDTVESQYIRTSGNEVYIDACLPHGFQTVRATYTTGWTSETLPQDLRQALIDLVGLKLQEVTNFSSDPASTDSSGEDDVVTGQLKKIQSLNYTEEYATTGSDAMWKAKTAQLSRTIGDSLPMGIQAVIDQYRKPFAL